MCKQATTIHRGIVALEKAREELGMRLVNRSKQPFESRQRMWDMRADH